MRRRAFGCLLPFGEQGRVIAFSSSSMCNLTLARLEPVDRLMCCTVFPGGKNNQPQGTVWLRTRSSGTEGVSHMNSVIYLIGLVVVVLAILSFLGIH